MSAAAKERPEFHDPYLRQALQDAAPAIETFTGRLDKLSADIKNLEAYLDRSGVRIRVEVPLPKGNDEQHRYSDDEYLEWGKGEPDRWRVLYYRMARHPEIENGWVTVDHGPLIEAAVPVRVRARGALPLLLTAVADAAMLGETVAGASDSPSAGAGNYKEPWGEESAAADLPPPSDDDIPF